MMQITEAYAVLLSYYTRFTTKQQHEVESHMIKITTAFITRAAAIAAIYTVLTLVFAPFSYGEIQVRFSEALTILPYFTPEAIPGLFIGCILANTFGGGIILDIIVGSTATLIGAIGTYLLRKNRWLAPLPPIIANTLLIPPVLKYGYGIPLPLGLLMLSLAAGEIISCYVLGELLLTALEHYLGPTFWQE